MLLPGSWSDFRVGAEVQFSLAQAINCVVPPLGYCESRLELVTPVMQTPFLASFFFIAFLLFSTIVLHARVRVRLFESSSIFAASRHVGGATGLGQRLSRHHGLPSPKPHRYQEWNPNSLQSVDVCFYQLPGTRVMCDSNSVEKLLTQFLVDYTVFYSCLLSANSHRYHPSRSAMKAASCLMTWTLCPRLT